MPDLIVDILKVVTSFFVALILNKFLSMFRKRQLYLSCWNSLDNTSLSNNAITVNASIFNKGKDKEKNVEIKVPNGMSCSVISSNYDVTTDSGVVKVDRVLANSKISLVLLIEGTRVLNKSTMPSIKSEDADGKTYLTNDSVPPGAGSLIFYSAILAAFVSYMFIGVKTDNDPFLGPVKAYNYMFHNKMYESGLSVAPIGNSLITDNYNLNANEYPVEIIEAKIEKKELSFRFRVLNTTSEPLEVSGKWRIYNYGQFLSDHVATFDYKDNIRKQEESLRIFKKYNVESSSEYGYLTEKRAEKVVVPPNSVSYLIMSRTYNPSLTYNDLNIEFEFTGGSGERFQEATMIFTAERSIISKDILNKR